MATVSPSRVMLATTSWKHYVALVDALGDGNPGLRVAFDAQTMEIMSPSFEHERVLRLIEFLLTRAFDLSGAEAISAGSTTYRREDVEKGVEPDLCFYVDRPNLRVSRQIELTLDAPPDLVIEIDLTRERMPKRGIYASFGVPEVWTFDGKNLRATRLVDGKYLAVNASVLLPWLPLADITSRIEQMHVTNNARLRLDWDQHVFQLLSNDATGNAKPD
jgi:Uma2 family endonuclease